MSFKKPYAYNVIHVGGYYPYRVVLYYKYLPSVKLNKDVGHSWLKQTFCCYTDMFHTKADAEREAKKWFKDQQPRKTYFEGE